MDRDRFWSIVAESRRDFDPERADGNMDRQCELLAEILDRLELPELIAFDHTLWQLRIESYRWDHWGAATILGEGICSDDWFEDFRSWLISMGRGVYRGALENPDSLAAVAGEPGIEDVFFEAFAGVATRVYREKTGEELPDSEIEWPEDPAGEPWRDLAELKRRYSRLWAEYGWEE